MYKLIQNTSSSSPIAAMPSEKSMIRSHATKEMYEKSNPRTSKRIYMAPNITSTRS